MTKFKFQIGQYVCHRAGGIRPSKMLVVSRGQMEQPGGGTQNLYICYYATASSYPAKSFLYENNLEAAGEHDIVSGVHNFGIIDEYHEYPIDPAKLDGPFLKVDEINPDDHGPASD